MTRPDPNSADSSANQDDAVWLDLVARLEGRDTAAAAGPGTGEGPAARDSLEGLEGAGVPEGTDAADGTAGPEAPDAPGGDDAPPAGSAPRPFSDFVDMTGSTT